MSGRPAIVLDTNVLEAAMRSRRGASFAVLSKVGSAAFDIALSVPLVFEYEEVLFRQCSASNRDESKVIDLLDYLCAVGQKQRIYYLWRPCLPDPKDEMVLEVAVAAGCSIIVTHNRRDFEAARQFGIRVLRPADFLAEIGE